MAEAQRKISKIATKLPSSNLKQEDVKFVAELVQYVGVLNGRNNLSISVHDSFNSKYKVIISQMPTINFDDIRNIEMMNKRITNIMLDLNRSYLIIESWKIGKEQKVVKKRRRIDDEYIELPSKFNLKEIEKNDLTQVKGVLKLFLNSTELEFAVKLQNNLNSYDLLLSKLEPLNISSIDAVLTKFKAFVTQVDIMFPQKMLKVSVRKTDSPLEAIAPYRRSVKVQKKN